MIIAQSETETVKHGEADADAPQGEVDSRMMFADWSMRRDLERRAAKARGRALKKRRKQKPAAPPEPEPIPYVAMRHLKVHEQAEGGGDDDAALAEIKIGERVLIFERTVLEDGSTQARISLDDGDAPRPLGWVPLSTHH